MSELEVALAGKNISDYTRQALSTALSAPVYGDVADMWRKYLEGLGLTGSVGDMFKKFYTLNNVPLWAQNPIYAGLYLTGQFTPASLFTGGEQGGWWSASDLDDTKLAWVAAYGGGSLNADFLAAFPNHAIFQDSAGVTPVTGVEQPVGLILDKRKNLELGPELVTNGSFVDGTGWTPGTGWTVSGGVATSNTAADGTAILNGPTYAGQNGVYYLVTATVTMLATPNTLASVGINIGGIGENVWAATQNNLVVGNTYTLRNIVKTNVASTWLVRVGSTSTLNYALNYTIDNISIRAVLGNHLSQATGSLKPVWSARKNLLLATATLSTQNVTTVATPYTISHTGTGTITLSGTSTAGPLVGAGSLTFTPTAGTLTITVSGTVSNAQLEYGTSVTSYQSVVTTTNYNAVGFPKYFLADGVDDGMATASVNFTATDKMSVFGGDTLLGNAGIGTLLELSTNAVAAVGAFLLYRPSGAAATDYLPYLHGSTSCFQTATPFPLFKPNVTTSLFDIAGTTNNDCVKFRANGSVPTLSPSGGNAGTGNFGTYPLYFGSRSGNSLYYYGKIYQLVILGRTATAQEITGTENYIANEMGVTL
jgi:hypothetical protein